MAKVDIVNEMLANHSTEEIIEWASISLSRAERLLEYTDDAKFVPEQWGMYLVEVRRVGDVLSSLKKKLVRDEAPVVA